MAVRYKTVLLFGAPGAGKGTQGELLGNIPGFYHLSTGDMFRALDRESELGRTFVSYSEKGELVPDELTIKLWQQYTNEQIESGKFDPDTQLLVLDGLPRTTDQAKLIDPLLDVLGVIHLFAMNKEAMVARLRQRALQQKRTDDAKEEVIRTRLEIYERDTRPVLDMYDASMVHEIDAMGTMAMVLMHVLDVVAPIHANSVVPAGV
ncbi:MAG: adenylate kinase [Phycisphaerae bacterium]|nr:adenylate kinase [Phycisphaerae bacterium]MBM90496.1 adenylate kinase [Phycisphaerae bacterium]HCT44127.1 adenylate kinase [Phycisphaerales bacterium]|tara:strand:+ start:133 stop:750 length:618 start_codon:yes stop_codon:yes gene_type:complete